MHPNPVQNLQIEISEDFITIVVPNKSGFCEVVAKAKTELVLKEFFGQAQTIMNKPLGITPRGLRFMSGDRSLYMMELSAGPVNVIMPKFSVNPNNNLDRITTLHMPRRFVMIKFDYDFTKILGCAIGVSQNHLYSVNDNISTFFGMEEFHLETIPTPNLSNSFGTVGNFLNEIEERIFSLTFPTLNASSFLFAPNGPSMPDQYTEAVAQDKTFLEFWKSEEELVYDWTFSNPIQSTPYEIMHLDEYSQNGSVDVSRMSYFKIVSKIMEITKKLDENVSNKIACEAYDIAMLSWLNAETEVEENHIIDTSSSFFENILEAVN